MSIPIPRRRMLIAYAAFYIAIAAAAGRAVFELRTTTNVRLMVGLLAFYLLLLLVEPFLVARRPASLHVFNILQTAITLILLNFVEEFDYFSLLFIPPCAQSILIFRRKTAFAWIGAICLVMILTLLDQFPLPESIGYVFTYSAGIFLFTGFSYLALQAEEAQLRSEALLADLQKANLRLQAYASQVQDLAAASERNRLARELHDSVTQIIFGLTLSAQAARILLDRDPSRVAGQLDHMQVLAQNALAEMRALIQQMHPRSVVEDGLAAGLRRLAAERQSSDGLAVDLKISGERRLPVNVEEDLFRIAQEALNNIVKHARTDRASITLDLVEDNRVSMCIEDAGAGFDPARAQSQPGHLGLASMAERIQALGGTLVIESKPGKGTRLRVNLSLAKEVVYA